MSHTDECQKARQYQRQIRQSWIDLWPKFCRECDASGVMSWYESHGPGLSEYMEDLCDSCYGKCPRCGTEKNGDTEEWYVSRTPCVVCSWHCGKKDDDIPPEWDGCCGCYEI